MLRSLRTPSPQGCTICYCMLSCILLELSDCRSGAGQNAVNDRSELVGRCAACVAGVDCSVRVDEKLRKVPIDV